MTEGRLPSSYRPIAERSRTVSAGSRTLLGHMANRSTSRRPSSRTAASRAEARRRARLAAQDYDDSADEEAEAEPAPRAATGLLTRFFPAAPPLKDKGDPFADFRYEGRFRSVVAALYLLRRNPWAWLLAGALWLLAGQFQFNDVLLLVGSIVQYGALAGAGWFGWQRPWLFGIAAAIVGWAPFVVLLSIRYSSNPGSLVAPGAAAPTFSQFLLYLGEQTVIQASIGFIAGWYGGYLRRRLAAPVPAGQAARARRR